MTTPARWIISQIGSREHYAVPRALHREGKLRGLYTEAWCRWGSGLLRRAPRQLRGLRGFAGRYHPSLASANVVSFTAAEFRDQLRRSGGHKSSTEDQFREFIRIGRDFALRVNGKLARLEFDPNLDAFFGYDTGCLETLELLREKGILTVVDQIDPARVEEQMVFEEAQRWPGWQAIPGRVPDEYYERLSREWATASLVLVNSTWSKTALVQQGVPVEKIIVVPLAYEPETSAILPRKNPDRPLVVLWLGSVILRKGIQYLIQAARRLEKTNIRFIVAGPVEISGQAIASAPKNMEFIGRVTRDRASEVYRAADVFVLPTISDGFAITQIEAMAHGLPVIATPNCGQVVTHGEDGYVVPVRDVEALAQAIVALDQSRDLWAEMSRHAIEKAGKYSLAGFVQNLEREIAENHSYSGAVSPK